MQHMDVLVCHAQILSSINRIISHWYQEMLSYIIPYWNLKVDHDHLPHYQTKTSCPKKGNVPITTVTYAINLSQKSDFPLIALIQQFISGTTWRMCLFQIHAARNNSILACSLVQTMPALPHNLTSSLPGEREENWCLSKAEACLPHHSQAPCSSRAAMAGFGSW